MRIGTWNLEGRWTAAHVDVMGHLGCDVWLLSEMNDVAVLPGYDSHKTTLHMIDKTRWSGILSRKPVERFPDPHPASCAASIDEILMCSSVLPWPLAGGQWPWEPAEYQRRFNNTVDQLGRFLEGRQVIWGGDWNQPLTGNLSGFTRAARSSLRETLTTLDLQVPTAALLGRGDAQASIDHIAVPTSWLVEQAGAVRVTADLSDHDVYFVEAGPR